MAIGTGRRCADPAGALLSGELENAARCAGRLPGSRVQGTEQGFEGSALVGFASVKRGLGNRHAETAGVQRDLGANPLCAFGIAGLSGKVSQGFAITDQLVENLFLSRELGLHPLPHYPKELLQLHTLKQIEKGDIAGCLGPLQPQCRTSCCLAPDFQSALTGRACG